MEYSKKIDEKWQKKWKENETYKYNMNDKKDKFYVLEMFSYPSGAKLHLGHWFNYGPSDSFARFKKMQGYNVFHPMGFDAFGLPAENYAIKTGIHPEDSTKKNIETMKRQLEEMGGSYDWNYSVETCMPDYYKWTQWLFIKLYEAGLAYKKEAPVNWCDSCKTVLANEQVIGGQCERCGSEVKRRKLAQWFFKITDYAEELLQDLKTLDWPESTKKVQINWIGKSEGSEIKFTTEDNKHEITVFTTRADTLCGVTYIVVAPESNLVQEITTEECKENVQNYIKETSKLSEIERLSTEKEKTGVFTGAYAINPINGEKVPIWIADYVLEDYGTGAVMAVPAHDTRDYAFAKKYNLPIKQVVESKDGTQVELPYTEYGILVNSNKYNGLTSEEGKIQITEDLSKDKKGNKTVNYRLKDWLVSRQRYWGAPIPIIYCDKCGTVPVPEKDLPVLLPYDVEFKPDGESPLKKSSEFMNCTCPKCGGKATREADTLDTFVCSSWYELRYPDSKNSEQAFNKDIINKIAPVDTYVGGKEHAAMHLIYARFMTKALRDLGYLNFDEPFKRLVHQGMILGPDGNKMSKSKGNTVSPEEYIEKYGADIFRMYIMFGFDYRQGGPWDEKGIESMVKYFSRIERLIEKVKELRESNSKNSIEMKEKELLRIKNQTIKSMGEDIDDFRFNTAIARNMELFNKISEYIREGEINIEVLEKTLEIFITLLAPLAPHFAEEQWEKLGKEGFVYNQKWPEIIESEMNGGTKDIPIQVNGKLKFCVTVDAEASADEILETIKNSTKVIDILNKYEVIKEIYVPSKIYNIVVKGEKNV